MSRFFEIIGLWPWDPFLALVVAVFAFALWASRRNGGRS